MAEKEEEMSERSEEIVAELGYERHHPAKDKRTQPQTIHEVQGRDCFQTPNYATDLLVPFIPKYITHVWECAAGMGKIAKRLSDRYAVVSTDLIMGFNFLTLEPDFNFDAIVTNPPFSLKRRFYNRCREYGVPFALLIPADYSVWIINACWHDGAEKIIPTRRIDYITPSGKSGATGNLADFHSMWLTWGFGLGRTETFVELTNEQKKENI